jgi:hypothetical protein
VREHAAAKKNIWKFELPNNFLGQPEKKMAKHAIGYEFLADSRWRSPFAPFSPAWKVKPWPQTRP